MVVAKSTTKIINKIWAENFLSIERAEIEMDAITVLVGPNAAGKSNVMDILRFVQDASLKGLELAIGNRGGIDAVARRSDTGIAQNVKLGVSMQGPGWDAEYSFSFANRRNRQFSVTRERLVLKTDGQRYNTELEIELSRGRLITSKFKYASATPSLFPDVDSTELSQADFSRWSIDEDFGDQDLVLISNQPVVRSGFLPSRRLLHNPRQEGHSTGMLDYRITGQIARALTSFVDHLHSMGFYRIFPNSLRDPQKMVESNPLTEDGSNLASAIQAMDRRNGSFMPELRGSLTLAVPEIKDVRVSPAGSYLVVELAHDETSDVRATGWFDLSSESDGTLRLLALLVAFFQEPSPTLFAVEEPEMNIHPGAMAVLIETMAEATERGQVLVTTHSPDLINMVPFDCIRAVSIESGSTEVGRVAEHQLQSVQDSLFTAGELHSMEGLQLANKEGSGKC